MKVEDLKQYFASEEMLKKDSGVGVVSIYQLKNGMSYLIMGEYHNKGALSPTVGARITKDQSMHEVIQDAFQRKRLGQMQFDSGEIDDENIYYSINAKQNFARVTFIQSVKVDLLEEEFKNKYVAPMHQEAQYQRCVSEFFWRLDETVNPNRKESKFKFKSTEECAEAAKHALENMSLSRFPVGKVITEKLIAMQDKNYSWNENILPLEFYGKNGGRKYSELTGFYLMSLPDILQQLKDPKIKAGKTDQDKPTVFIEHASLPKEEKWKKFFIFEDEIKTIAEIMYQLTSSKGNTTMFRSNFISKQIDELVSPWTVEKINSDKFKLLDVAQKFVTND